MSQPRFRLHVIVMIAVLLLACIIAVSRSARAGADNNTRHNPVVDNATQKVLQGEQIFRFDTFGDEAFWGDTLKLHQAIEGAKLGGVGPGVSPKTALAVGLKVDVDALPPNLLQQIEKGKVNLDDPAVTLTLLKLNAVVGLTGSFNPSGTLKSVGIQCALCHSTVDNSIPALCAGQITPNPATGCIGHRLDGWANRDLNVGAIVAVAPDLSVIANLLSTDQATVRKVLNSWGPGKFDAELLLDGRAFNPQQVTDGVVTGTNVSGASLIPPPFGLGGVNLHTWIGWGSVPHWNAFVANLEMHGKGRFFDPRLNNAAQFPIALPTASRICLTSTPMMISLLPNLQPCSSISYPSLHQTQPCLSIRQLPHAATSCSAGRQDAITVMRNHFGQSRDGICTSPPMSVSTASRQTVGRICATALRPSARSLLTLPVASITTDASLI